MNPDTLQKIIASPSSADVLVKEAHDLAILLAQPPRELRIKALSTSQIRAIYGEVLRIKADWLESRDEDKKKKAHHALLLLRPKMAYRARKEGGAVQELVKVLDPAIVLVGENEENFRRFYEFFEAILAYHKAEGGS